MFLNASTPLLRAKVRANRHTFTKMPSTQQPNCQRSFHDLRARKLTRHAAPLDGKLARQIDETASHSVLGFRKVGKSNPMAWGQRRQPGGRNFFAASFVIPEGRSQRKRVKSLSSSVTIRVLESRARGFNARVRSRESGVAKTNVSLAF